jgi:hypothetical protein
MWTNLAGEPGQGFNPAIPTTWKTEIGGLENKPNTGKVRKTLSQKQSNHQSAWGIAQGGECARPWIKY